MLARVQGMDFASEASVRDISVSAAVLAIPIDPLTHACTPMQSSRRWPDGLERRCGEKLAGNPGLSRRASAGGTKHQPEWCDEGRLDRSVLSPRRRFVPSHSESAHVAVRARRVIRKGESDV